MIKPNSSARRPCSRIVLCIGAVLALAGCDTLFPGVSVTDKSAAAKLAQDQFAPALRLARASRSAGDMASAINLYRSVVALKPADPAIVVELGDTLVDAGSIDDAIDVYQQVDQKSAAWLGALLGLERTHLALAEPEKALQDADQAQALAPDDARVLIARGVALDMLDRHKEAQDAYRAVLETTPHNIAARNNLALSLALTKQYPEAILIMTAMARSSTTTPRIRQNLALIYGLAGDKERAVALSRVDLDARQTEGNLRFFDLVRGAPN